jgi:hypothetical protein
VVVATGWTRDQVLALSYEAATEILRAYRRRDALRVLETAQAIAALAYGTAASSRDKQEALIKAAATGLLKKTETDTDSKPTADE